MKSERARISSAAGVPAWNRSINSAFCCWMQSLKILMSSAGDSPSSGACSFKTAVFKRSRLLVA